MSILASKLLIRAAGSLICRVLRNILRSKDEVFELCEVGTKTVFKVLELVNL